VTLASPFRRTTLFVLLAFFAALPSSSWSSATVSLPPSMSLANEDYSAWIAARNAEWREAFDKAPAACQALVRMEIPPASGAWCRQSFNASERAIHAAPDLLLRAATIGPNGPLSGLGALHSLVNQPDTLERDKSGRSFRDEVFHIVGTGMQASAMDAQAIDTMIGQLTALCVRLEEAHSGIEGLTSPGGVVRSSTDQCMLATAVLEWERTGLSARNYIRADTTDGSDLTLGNRVDMAQDHALQSAGMLSHPSRAGYAPLPSKDGLRETSSLLTMQRYVIEMLQPCQRFVSRAREHRCVLP